MKNYWTSWYTWCHHLPETGFKYWITGSGCRDRVPYDSPVAGKSVKEAMALAQIEFDKDAAQHECVEDWASEYGYVMSDASICAHIQAESEEQVWEIVGKHFPDYEFRFIDEVPMDHKLNDRFP